ncbi:unnamed protein product [Cylicocyclus nassatus]|uniref:Uncharacterized protein n=1 Tax=Cylicocyclus nassatus TaxID=53992 RepID=A0AA36MAU9_CYLNA|nr:unnamed protein product [Cylicocyclus nassatus]
MSLNPRQELSASSKENGFQRMHSDTTHSDHIYNYIEEQKVSPKKFFNQRNFSVVTQNIKLRYALISAAFIIVLAVILTVVLTLKAKGNNEDSEEPKELVRTIFFAFNTDYDVQYKEVRNDDKCNLTKNIVSTQHAILEMKDQRFRFILFADKVKTSESMDWLKAIDKLETAMSHSNPQTTFKQYLVLQEFVDRAGNDDLLVYFVPCNFNYSASDSDMEIVRAMIRLAHIEEHVLIIFAKEDGESIKEWYGVNISHVVGKGENVVDRIVRFVLMETTKAESSIRTEPIFQSTATVDATSTYVGTPTSEAPKSINCVCVVDLQYITKAREIDKEKSLILKVTDTLFKERQDSTAGIWAYGAVAQKTDFTNVFNNMCDTYEKFEAGAHTAMQRGSRLNDLGENFTTVNTATGPEGKVDNLLFMWGAEFVPENWVITPGYNYKNIVVVSLQGANFMGHIDDRGKIINVVLDDYKDEDVQKIVDALIS